MVKFRDRQIEYCFLLGRIVVWLSFLYSCSSGRRENRRFCCWIHYGLLIRIFVWVCCVLLGLLEFLGQNYCCTFRVSELVLRSGRLILSGSLCLMSSLYFVWLLLDVICLWEFFQGWIRSAFRCVRLVIEG